MGVKCEVMIPDLQSSIDAELSRYVSTRSTASYFDNYHPWEEVHAYIEQLASEFPDLATVSTIGHTYQGKPMKIISMSSDRGIKKPTLWFDGGMHAREWISVSTATFAADSILRNHAGVQAVRANKPQQRNASVSSSEASSLLDNFNVIVLPIINIDGYAYTWASDGDRMWRKTRTPNPNAACVGTDANRNFGFHWGEAGTSDKYCSDIYHGPSPASEVEVKTLQDYICAHNDTIVGYVDLHSYSQLWMSSWSYTKDVSPDYDQQNGLSKVGLS